MNEKLKHIDQDIQGSLIEEAKIHRTEAAKYIYESDIAESYGSVDQARAALRSAIQHFGRAKRIEDLIEVRENNFAINPPEKLG